MDLVKTNADIEEFRKKTGSSSVMLARAAMWNVSVFSPSGPFPLEKVMEDYLKYAIRYENHAFNTKYCLCQMLRDKVESPQGKLLQAAQTHADISAAFGLQQFCQQTEDELQKKRSELQGDCPPDALRMEGDVSTMAVKFIRSEEQPRQGGKIWGAALSGSRLSVHGDVCREEIQIFTLGRIGDEESDLVCKRKRDGRTNGTTEEEQSSKRHSGDMRQEEETLHVNGDDQNANTPPEKLRGGEAGVTRGTHGRLQKQI
ncbi:hypothetical protein F7725_023389 [Dissostichus mawsoni]|uniref:Uncharacterized protein n=1 Tax=Dissostichus mawsoni TaxID=36200 RepID=A0A7J5Z0K5_DISMA|nr:hypothetical protein F7725_023389 [Dissostichus mawsoni]